MAERYILPFLEMTSQRMYMPHIGGFVHIFGALAVTIAAITFSVYLNRPDGLGSSTRNYSGKGDRTRIKIFAGLGWILLLMEIYKQLFCYYIINDEAYDFWLFPFQLCSVPMYLCILLPLVNNDVKKLFITFMAGFTFVSSIAALIYPEDMLKPYVSLTCHGFIWHGILLFISLLAGFSGMADLSVKGFLKSAALFIFLCVIAICLNAALEHMSTISYPNMFYLSPYHPSNQPFVDIVEKTYGRYAAMAAYTAAVIALAGISDLLFRMLGRRNH